MNRPWRGADTRNDAAQARAAIDKLAGVKNFHQSKPTATYIFPNEGINGEYRATFMSTASTVLRYDATRPSREFEFGAKAKASSRP